ncbi:hypothetical protein B0H99_10730 [Planomicrobium soli]|uniref:PH (Pleckstrin Homology) domain-containing protein n=1 Tax=Planomicrobium soli TaxID=1176648 RepID=A0A2P8GQF8_9BACL|nr:hypothetical protein [Planomicrobium soli]PSL36209.1 hypothetical protein B0H99_10730 [Planomicrobium soli]
MKKSEVYRLSMTTITVFTLFGILFFSLMLMSLDEFFEGSLLESILAAISGIFFSILFTGYGIYLWKKRKQGYGFWWDDEGVVIDLNGTKVYWNEIENITLSRGYPNNLLIATVIYPHYTHHEKIRMRRKKWMPTPAHSITWYMIEKPQEFHDLLMNVWAGKRHSY